MKFNSQWVLGEGGEGRYGEQLVYLGSLLGATGGLFDRQGQHEQVSVGSPSREHASTECPSM